MMIMLTVLAPGTLIINFYLFCASHSAGAMFLFLGPYFKFIFLQVIVRGGGHILPYDQPERSLDMIDRFILNKGWKP